MDLKIFSNLTAALVLILMASSCTIFLPQPQWNGKLWAGDSANVGISRSQSDEFIEASDPLFDEYLAMSYEDFRSFYTTYVLGCKQWKTGVKMMSPKEVYQRFNLALTESEKKVLKKHFVKED